MDEKAAKFQLVKNQEAINKPFIKAEFSKYVHNASAAEIIKSKFSKEQIEEIEKLKGKSRAAKEEEIFKRIKTMGGIYTRIFNEVYELTMDIERAKNCYDAAKLPEFEHAVLKWNDGKISSYELIAILEGEADPESEDSMYTDVPDLYDDDELR